MEMTRLEKHFVNRESKSRHNIELVRQRLNEIGREKIHHVLELGCGVGYVSAFLAKVYKMHVIGTDFDVEQIERARRLHHEGELLQFKAFDASHLTCNDASFDLVISQNVFHHVAEWRRVVQEVGRVLRSGGYFIWLDLAFSALAKKLLQPWSKTYGIYTFEEVRKELQQDGLTQLFYEKLGRGLFAHHHLVLQKTTNCKD
jgi:ubiquinone/menaquinone biosynthesis C-methylase UbiE